MDPNIFKTELRLLLRDRGSVILILAFGVLLAYGLYNGANWAVQRSEHNTQINDRHRSWMAEKRQQIEDGFTGSREPGNFVPDPADPFTIGTELHYAVQPITAAAMYSVGQSDVLPGQWGISLLTLQQTKADKSGFENPMTLLLGKFDAAFVMVFLLPLVILALSFDILSGERESGTLQMLLSEPVTLRTILISKLTARYAFLSVPILTAIPIAAILAGTGALGAEFWLRTAIWLVIGLAYAGVWFAIAAFINSFVRRSSTNAVAGVAVWLLFVLVLPSLIGIVVSSIFPLPSRTEVTSAIRGVNLDMRRDGEKLLTEYYQDHPELLPKDGKTDLKAFGLAFVYIQQQHKERIAEVETRFEKQLGKQQQLVSFSRFLSPAIAVSEAISDVAGTGGSRSVHFKTQAKDHDREWNEYFRGKVFRLEKLSATEVDQIPKFEYVEEPTGAFLVRTGVAFVFLFAVSGALLWLAFERADRFRFDQ